MSKSKAALIAFVAMIVGVGLFLAGSRLSNPPVTVVQVLHDIPKGEQFSANNV